MAITGNTSLNRVEQITGNFKVYFNISAATGTGNLAKYELFFDDVSQGETPLIPQAQTTGNVEVAVFATNIGFHTFGVLFTDTSGNSEYFSETIYLDRNTPIIHNFSLIDILTSDDSYYVEFDVDVEDDTGISNIVIYNSFGHRKQYFLNQSAVRHTGRYRLEVPKTFTNRFAYFYLEVNDYSGNEITSSPIRLYLSNQGAKVTSYKINRVINTGSTYRIFYDLSGSIRPQGYLKKYTSKIKGTSRLLTSGSFIVPGPNWNTTITIDIPHLQPEGDIEIEVSLYDEFDNITVHEFDFTVDKTNPVGQIEIVEGKKVGTNYIATVRFSATDAGGVLGVGSQIDSDNLNWNYVASPQKSLKQDIDFDLGEIGRRTIFGQFSDICGNLTPLYKLDLEIDNTRPDAEFRFLFGSKRPDGNYSTRFQTVAADNKGITHLKLYGINSNTGNFVAGHTNNWFAITETKLLDEAQSIIIDQSEYEDKLTFYFQAKDIFGNESPIRTANVLFDKSGPTINTFAYFDADKNTSYYRIYFETDAYDNKGISHYKVGLNDILAKDWIPIEVSNKFNSTLSLDIPTTQLGIPQEARFQLKDVFGNETAVKTFTYVIDDSLPEVDDFKFDSASMTRENYVLNFKIDAHDTGAGNVYWYSITANDSTMKNWKQIPNNAPVVSETMPFEFPLTNDGTHEFYLRVADMNKNESAVYKYEYDLDSVNVSGGIQLRNIIKDPITYYANVELYAIDNRNVDGYKLNGGGWSKLNPPVKRFNEYQLIPLGLSEGPRKLTVQYRDGFFNETKEYSINLNVDATDPTANIYANGVSSTPLSYDLTLDLDMKDNQELAQYKFWYTPDGEPSWSDIPVGLKSYKATQTFTIPKFDTTPNIAYRIKDFFENEISGVEVKQLVTTPPFTPAISISNVYHQMTGTEVTVNYNGTAAANTTINKLEVKVNPVGTTTLETYEIKIPNQVNAIGQFKYTLPLSERYARIAVKSISDYGFKSSEVVAYRPFENIKPTANVIFTGAFEDNYDYILQFRTQIDDVDSGLRHVEFKVNSYPTPRVHRFDFPFKRNVDEIINLRIDQTHIANHADIEVTVVDMAMNSSVPISIPNVYLDRFRPAITNVILNHGMVFGGGMVGVNKNIVPFSFEASDFSTITHYKYSKEANIVFDHSWTEVLGEKKNIAISENADLARMGFIQGQINTLYVHAKDKFNNIGTAGISFEFDSIPPDIKVDFDDHIERKMVHGVDHFVVPYTVRYDDNYCEIWDGMEYYDHYGNSSTVTPFPVYPKLQVGTFQRKVELPVKHWGNVDINVKVRDRLDNWTPYEKFQVYLENTAPVIWQGTINDGATYTFSKDVFVKMDMSDLEGVTEVLFSKSNTEVWNSAGWFQIPYAPRKQANTAFTVDLDALGFTDGVCNVHMYAKDFCQNITQYSNTIIFDRDAPNLTSFYINNISRSIDTFDIELIGEAWDNVSGWNEYYMSFSPNELNFDPIIGGPIIGTTSHKIRKIINLPIKDAGQKIIYFAGKDAAGNISAKRDVSIYIDNKNPVASVFYPTNLEKYYLNATANNFAYVVSDDHALVNIAYQINSGPKANVSNFAYSSRIQLASGNFDADFTGLLDGKHNIHLYAEDQFENRVRVPYEFILDTTPPQINTLNVLETRPAFNGNTKNYDVALEFTAQDAEGIRNYELYDNGSLVSSVNVDNKNLDETLSVTSIISSANTELHTYELKVYDYANNMSSATTSKLLHDGANTSILDFKVNGTFTHTTTTSTTETFSGNVESDVTVTQYAITTKSNVDLDSAFWNSFAVPASAIYYSENISLSEFAISTHVGANTVYLHIADDCGNIETANVYIDITDSTSPIISNVTPTVVLQRQGKYYVGTITFDIKDPNSMIEAYAIGTVQNPTNYKSIYRTNNSTLTHSLKIAEDDIAGSQIFYLQLRDVNGNLSNNYRMSVRLVDLKIEPIEIKLNKYITGTEKVTVDFKTNAKPNDIEFGYQVDTTYKPNIWNSPATLVRTTLGKYSFEFDLDVTSIPKGDHKLYVWLRDKNTHEHYNQCQSFVSEPTPEKPYAILSIEKTEYRNDLKTVWVNANITDLGVGVASISLIETGNPDNFESINIIQTGNYLKKFEYDKNDVRNIIYECKLRDAVNTSSFMFATSVDLSDVY